MRLAYLTAALVAAALGGPVAAQTAALPAAALAMHAALPRMAAPFAQGVVQEAGRDAAIAGFYRDRDFAPLWTGSGDAARRAALMAALDAAPLHALPDFGAADLRARFAAARSEGDRGRIDVAMTRAFLAYARAAETGVLDPSDIENIVRTVDRRSTRDLLNAFAAAEPAAFLRALPPASPEYLRLVRTRAALLAADWGPAVPARSLRPGDTGPAVVALRDRLVRMGHMRPSPVAEYGAAIADGVRAFQLSHGLEADGVADAATMAAINVPLADRLGALAVAMERERWLPRVRGDRHIWVNLADFSAKIIDDGKVSFETRAVIGALPSDTHTPEFSHRMTFLEINPDWTVPRGIIRRTFLPQLQANRHALGHLQVLDAQGRVVPRDQIDFAAFTARTFPFTLRQPPGPTNALGRVKFMFPNPWAIYLHDTPERHLFGREVRAYSAGCVRLAEPFEFAYRLLERQEADPRAVFHRVLDSGRQTRIFLDDPVPIHLDYRTAFTGARGEVHFRRDIYGRDAAILAALVRAGVDPAAMPR